MKKIAIITTSVLFLALSLCFTKYPILPDEITIGTSIPKPELKMIDAFGKSFNLNALKTTKGLLVIFSCNTCPYVKLSETRIKESQKFCGLNNIGIAIINSNEDQRDGDDSPEEMKKYAISQAFTAPYLLDLKSELANAFGATKTPQCFLFDASGKLIYKGAIDDNVKDSKIAVKHYLMDALSACFSGSKPAIQETKSIGCTIKRSEAE